MPEERWRLGGIVRGDFFRAKGAVEAVYEALHVEPRFERAQPIAGATVGATTEAGWIAQYGRLDLDGEWSAFELDLADLFAAVPERILYRDVVTYPPLREDFAFVVDEAVPAGELIAAAREAGGNEVASVRFLSDYRGEPIPSGQEVGRDRGRLPVGQPDAVRGGRRPTAGGGHRGACREIWRHPARLTRISVEQDVYGL